MAAISFMYSALYTIATEDDNRILFYLLSLYFLSLPRFHCLLNRLQMTVKELTHEEEVEDLEPVVPAGQESKSKAKDVKTDQADEPRLRPLDLGDRERNTSYLL